MKRVSLSILFLALLLLSSTAFARIPYENNKDKTCPKLCPDHRGRFLCCKNSCCGDFCCSNEESPSQLKLPDSPAMMDDDGGSEGACQ